jgi:uncharacterized protein YehS (DUF1456 family)
MPTNLNALTRYKALDKCLSNRYSDCTVDKMIEVCSDALFEKRGRDDRVSIRTIRDDIRVLRSDILGFNAPIAVSNGVYYYSDKKFSLFQKPINHEELLREVLIAIQKNQESFNDNKLIELMKKISHALGEEYQAEYYNKYSSNGIDYSIRSVSDEEFLETELEIRREINEMLKHPPGKMPCSLTRKDTGFTWEDIFCAF